MRGTFSISPVVVCLAGLLLGCPPVPASAQASSPSPVSSPVAPVQVSAGASAVHGVATTQGKSIRLPGVTVSVLDAAGKVVETTVTDGEGNYRLTGLQPGTWTIVLSLDGFDAVRRSVVLVSNRDLEVDGDLEIAKVTEHLEVVQETYAEPMATTLASREVLDGKAMQDSSLTSGSVDSALAMLAGVVFGPEGLSIRGGRPSQSAMLLGGANMGDASVGTTRFQLPSEAVASVEVLPNPYAVEFGRFSSGVTLLTTRRGTDSWQAGINNLDPGLRTRRGDPWKITGVRVFAPHAWFGGPLIKDKLFLAQTNHFDYRSYDILSRPDDQRTSQRQWSSFTRLDANLSPGHTATLTVGLFPEKRTAVNLDTFTPPDSTFDMKQHVYNVSLSDTRTLSATRVFETTVQASRYNVGIEGHGTAPMVIQPQGISGSYFNRQDRQTNAFQWVASVSDFRQNLFGEHLMKAGVDLLRSEYDGETNSLPVEIRRVDGTLARELLFSPTSRVGVSSTDLGLFVQDRWRPANPLIFELGMRLDRDGALDRANFTPRAGVAWLLKRDGSITLRGGVGLFYERTPLVVRAFEQFEQRMEVRYAADGVTLLGPPTVFLNRVDGTLKTPGSATWNVQYDHRFNKSWSFRVSHLQRRGSHELIVNPVSDESGSALVMSSTGRSFYRETELAARYAHGTAYEVSLSYIRSSSMADLNNYASYFGADRNPVIGQNEYGPTPSDTPNRFVGRMHARLGPKWSVSAFTEIRTGFPYSAVNEWQDYVGLRDRAGRFPLVTLTDLALERRIHLWKWTPWIGVRILNAFNAFVPLDVQTNVTSSQYGGFYNPVPRQFRLTLRVN